MVPAVVQVVKGTVYICMINVSNMETSFALCFKKFKACTDYPQELWRFLFPWGLGKFRLWLVWNKGKLTRYDTLYSLLICLSFQCLNKAGDLSCITLIIPSTNDVSV